MKIQSKKTRIISEMKAYMKIQSKKKSNNILNEGQNDYIKQTIGSCGV